MAYDAFISYCRDTDAAIAAALRDALEQYAKPWYRRRALSVYPDEPGGVTGGLAESMRASFATTGWFVLLLSVESARSPWVNLELAEWLQAKPRDRIALVLTSGDVGWNPATHAFDRGSVMPPALRAAFRGDGREPHVVDLRWARCADAAGGSFDLRNPRFHDAAAALAAPMHGVPSEVAEARDLREHRRAARLRRATLTSLSVLTAASLMASTLTQGAQGSAREQLREAQAAEAAAEARAVAATKAALRARAEAYEARLLMRLAERRLELQLALAPASSGEAAPPLASSGTRPGRPLAIPPGSRR